MMDYITGRLIVVPTVAIGSVWLVARYKVKGGIASVLLGWVILWSVYNAWPAPPSDRDWDEDRENMWIIAPVLVTVWCCLVYTAFEIRAWVNRRGKWTTWPTKPDSPS